MSVARYGCRGCVMSYGRFAVLGGTSNDHVPTSSCEVLTVDSVNVSRIHHRRWWDWS
jgi:hypothetical protein